MPDPVNKNDARLGTLETKVASIGTEVHHLRGEISNIGNAIRSLNDKVSSKGTDWKTLAAWASVLLGVMVYHGRLAMQPVELRINESYRTLSSESILRDSAQQKEIKALQDKLLDKVQDIHRLQDKTDERIHRLHVKINEHVFDGHPERVEARVEALKELLERVEKEQARRTTKVYKDKNN